MNLKSKSNLFWVGVLAITFSVLGCKSDADPSKEVASKSEALDRPKKKKKKQAPIPKSTAKTKSVKLSNTVMLGSIDYDLINARLLQKINQERKKHSLPSFSNNNDLIKAAKIHNDYMVRYDVLDHSENGTSTPTMRDRITKVGGKFRTAGENIQYEGFIIRTTNGVESIIAPTYEALAEQLWQNWKTSPPHYKNIMNPEFIYLGTSLKWSDKKTAVFATQVYGG